MLRQGLDILYIVFVLALLFGIATLDVIHWPVWPKAWVPEYMHGLEKFNIRKFNDPLSASLAIPNGWQSAMYLCEQIHLPFLFYFLFGKSNNPLLSRELSQSFAKLLLRADGIKKELGAIVVGTQIAVVVTCCLFEIAAFDDKVVSKDQKHTLMYYLYGPFLVIPVIMVVDMLGRVHKRVETAERAKKTV